MSNVIAVVNDIFDILSESSLKKGDLSDTMVEILNTLSENRVLEGYETELDELFGISGVLDDAINEYYSQMMEDSDDDDEPYEE